MSVTSSIKAIASEAEISHLAAGKEPFILRGGEPLAIEQFMKL